jgi:hypothetical protein
VPTWDASRRHISSGRGIARMRGCSRGRNCARVPRPRTTLAYAGAVLDCAAQNQRFVWRQLESPLPVSSGTVSTRIIHVSSATLPGSRSVVAPFPGVDRLAVDPGLPSWTPAGVGRGRSAVCGLIRLDVHNPGQEGSTDALSALRAIRTWRGSPEHPGMPQICTACPSRETRIIASSTWHSPTRRRCYTAALRRNYGRHV